jgi:hypothetical protein
MARFQPCLFPNNRRTGGNACAREWLIIQATRGASIAQVSLWICAAIELRATPAKHISLRLQPSRSHDPYSPWSARASADTMPVAESG